ncbi:Collagen triple helix repeat domain protein, partial [Operophtera brumata]
YPLLLTLFSLTQTAYISRMSVNRVRSPSVFRPGLNMQRPWTQPRIVQAASYAVKHYSPSTRNVFAGGPWKTTARMPGLSPVTPEYEFVRAASSSPLVHNDGGAIHTIPAPNLSLSEKPIVVIEASENQQLHNNPATELTNPKPTYEVTEKYPENVFEVAKIETPVGFSKQSLQATPELQNLLRNGAAFQQMANEYGLSSIGIPQNQIIPQTQHYTIQGFSGLQNQQGFNGIHSPQGFNGIQSPQGFNGIQNPQEFNGIQSQQGFNGIHTQQGFHGLINQQSFNVPTQQELLSSGADGIMIQPNALYQSDPMFLQKLQTQLLHRFPSVEFIPYTAEIQNQNTNQNSPQHQAQQLLLLENEELKQEPFVPSESKNVVQREASEGSVVALSPQNDIVYNATEKSEPTTTVQSVQPHNITLELIAAESRPVTTTIKYVIESTEKENTDKQNTTPIYYAQVGQSVGNMIASGFYSAINEVRAASASEQVEKPNETTIAQMNMTTIGPDLKPYFAQTNEKEENKNKTGPELRQLLGVPFAKSPDSVKQYTVLRPEEKEPKNQGAFYAGQIVEASISEDQDFNKEKTNLLKRPSLRLFAVTEKKDVPSTATSSMPKVTVVKAKIPPKSKLSFDEETGEPILRIYASYVNGPTQVPYVI